MTDFNTGIMRNLADEPFAFASVCSAHPDVLHASLWLAKALDAPIVVEATSNQVNQFGGYTGMRPDDFVDVVRSIAAKCGLSADQIILGGDHLGPQAWRDRSAADAMALAEEMVAEYVRAGFTKIHLDCSEGCAGEPPSAGDKVAAARAARLALACEAAAGDQASKLSYIVGTEVPAPRGARAGEDQIVAPTSPENAAATLRAHKDAFHSAGVAAAWQRVRGLVVQPGLEFAPDYVDRFDTRRPAALANVLTDFPDLCFEAHSTDYQFPEVFSDLARRHFAILKVGPALTFAYREAIYALSAIDVWMTGTTHINDLLENKMPAKPHAWSSHYHGDETRKRLLRHFGYADRIRYFWSDEEVQQAVRSLEERIDASAILEPLLEQYIDQAWRGRTAALRAAGVGTAKSIIYARIQAALDPYLKVATSCR